MISFFRHFPSYNGSEFHLKFQIDLLTSGTVHVTDFLYYDPAFFYFMEVKLAIFCEVFIVLIYMYGTVHLCMEGPSLPWSYGSCIYNHIYAISAYHHWCCEFESRSGWGVVHYVIKFVSDLRQVSGFLRILRFPPPIKLTTTI